MALEHVSAMSSNPNLWLKLLLEEAYPPDSVCRSPCKVSSSPRSSLDMILECEEDIPDVRLDAIPEAPEDSHVDSPLSTSAPGCMQGSGGRGQGKDGEERFLEECFQSLVHGSDWPKVRSRTEDLYDSRYPKDFPPLNLRRTVSEPLPTILETEDSEQWASTTQTISVEAASLRTKYMAHHPLTSVEPPHHFEATLPTLFEVEEDFAEPALRQDQGQHSDAGGALSAHFPEDAPLRLPAFFPGLTAVGEGKEEGGAYLTVYPWGLMTRVLREKPQKGHLRTVAEDKEGWGFLGRSDGVRAC